MMETTLLLLSNAHGATTSIHVLLFTTKNQKNGSIVSLQTFAEMRLMHPIHEYIFLILVLLSCIPFTVFYPLDDVESQYGGWVGLSDITNVGEGEYLVLERDNQGGPDAAIKRIYHM